MGERGLPGARLCLIGLPARLDMCFSQLLPAASEASKGQRGTDSKFPSIRGLRSLSCGGLGFTTAVEL